MFTNPFDIFGGLAGLGILCGGLGFAYSQFTSGGSKAKDDLITTLRETALAEKDKAERLAVEKATIMNSHQEQLNALNEKVGKLQGLYESSESQKKEYLAILQGRSPEQEQYMKDMRAFTAGVATYMKDSAEIFAGMKTFMTALNEKATTIEKRNIKVDAQKNKKIKTEVSVENL